MAQNQNNSEGVYKKLSRAVSFSPFKQTTRPKPWQPKTSIFTTFQQNPQLQTTNNVDQIKVGRKEVVLPRGHVGTNGASKETYKDNDHKFTDYIRKMKDKMRTASSSTVGTTTATVRRDSFNDKVSSYINRAKFKIRTTSNVGDDNRGSSFK